MNQLLRFIIILISLFLGVKSSAQQIAYHDSCLSLELYSEWDRNTQSKHSIELAKYDMMDDSALQLRLVFRNSCDDVILIQSEFNMVDFHIEGQKFSNGKYEPCNPLVAYDYFSNPIPRRERIISPNGIFWTAIKCPLGIDIKSIGNYRFRIVYLNQSNHIPVADFKTYHTNWINLEVK